MEGGRQDYEPVTYDDAGHGFMRRREDPPTRSRETRLRVNKHSRVVKLLQGL